MEIKLSGKHGGVAIVDKEYYELLSQYSWYLRDDGYVQTTINGKKIRMHKFLMKLIPPGMIVDHINRIRHDNRMSNLRIILRGDNNKNSVVRKNKIGSQYRGVYYKKTTKKYCVKLISNNKQIHLGYFDNKLDAAIQYDMYIVHNHLKFHNLNFEERREEYLKMEFKPFISKKQNKSCKYIGVTFNKQSNSYRVFIKINKKSIYLGSSKDPLILAIIYDKYIVDNQIPCKKLNFPDDHPQYKPYQIKINTQCEEVDEFTVRLIINSESNAIVLIDKEDYNRVKYYTWSINDQGYVTARVNGKLQSLHRFITKETDPNIFIDHINSNPLDNTKQNLRKSNDGKNSQNRSKIKNCSSNYIGVYYSKRNKKWISQLTFNGDYFYIGNDSSQIYAARRRDLFILDNFSGEHYKMNFAWDKNQINKWRKKLNVLPVKKQIENDTLKMIDLIETDNDRNYKSARKQDLLIIHKRKQIIEELMNEI